MTHEDGLFVGRSVVIELLCWMFDPEYGRRAEEEYAAAHGGVKIPGSESSGGASQVVGTTTPPKTEAKKDK